MGGKLRGIFNPGGRTFPIIVLAAVLLLLTGRYLLYGVPHEFLTGEYKATFEGDYDFTLELYNSFRVWRSLPLWSETYSGPIAVFASNLHVFEEALLYPLTHDLAVSIKILQAIQFFVAGVGMYLLSDHLFKDRVAAAFSAVLYMFTPFYIGHLLSYLHYTGVYLLAPLVYLFILKTFEERSYYYAAALSLVTAYSLLSHPQNVFIGGLFYSLFFIMVFLHGLYESVTDGEMRPYLKRISTVTAFIIICVFLLAAFITLPTLVDNYPYLRTSWVKGAGEMVKVDSGHISTHSQTLLGSITLQHWPWFQTPLKGGEYPPWGYTAVYMLPFAFAAASLLINVTWITVVFLVLTVLSVQTALGIHGRPDLFSLASKYIPFFGMSRTPYAYINSAILVFCLFASVTFGWFSGKLTGDKTRATWAGWALFALLVVPYLMAARYYGNDYNWTLISSKEPRYLSSVWGWLEKNNKERARVIETCGIPTAMLLTSRMLPNEVDLLERYHKKDYLGAYLSLLGFKYIITPSMHSQRDKTFDVKGYMVPSVFDRTESMEEYYSALTTEYYYIYERLKADPGFKAHTAGTKDVAIFENGSAFKDYELYPARAIMVLGGTEAYDILNIERFKRGLRPAPVFIAESDNLNKLGELKKASADLVLHNTDALDLLMLLRGGKMTRFRPAPEKPRDWDLSIFSFGIQQPFPQQDHSIGNSLFGEMTFSDYAITTKVKGSVLRNYFDIKSRGRYRVMLRAYCSEDSGDLSAAIDSMAEKTVKTDGARGYNWITLWEGELEPGGHSVEIRTQDSKPVYLDTVAIGEPAMIDMGAASVFDSFDQSVTYVENFRRFKVSDEKALTVVNVGSTGRYRPSVRLARFAGLRNGPPVRVLIDNRQAGEIRVKDLKDRGVEFRLPEVVLSPGPHTISIENLQTGVWFDYFSLFAEGTRAEEKAPSFEYKKTGPSSYSFEVDSTAPLFVVFNETNYPGWRMEIDSKGHKPYITNMFMNGFIVPGGGKKTHANIVYSNTAQRTGVWASIVTFFVLIGFLFIGRKGKGRG
ncbi:MAG: hypothetical protein HY891_01615 [Deltaproteobacteria bacterium]|nr:hypothetical protein [Deltaproteobacteria bacterium]